MRSADRCTTKGESLLWERYQDTPEFTQYMDAQSEAESKVFQDAPHADAPSDSALSERVVLYVNHR